MRGSERGIHLLLIIHLFIFFVALLSQVMQYYFLNMLKTLRFGGKEVKEEDIIKWMNDKVAALPRAPTQATQRARITGFKDPALSTGLVFIDLLHALRPGCVAQELVQRGETREQSLANAKYIISVARKIGIPPPLPSPSSPPLPFPLCILFLFSYCI